ncbi:MAG: hypothetical protein EXS08_12315 [Planctomycetes bacterium]|nr:hypothetical protein [Planctomycetota bacterium]
MLAVLSPSVLAQDVPAAGFSLGSAPFPGASSLAATTTLANGDLVVFDGMHVRQYDSGGGFLHDLGALPAFAFPSFVLADPSEQQVFFGESSTGAIYRLFLGLNSSPDFVVALPFNYDAAMIVGSALFVSAATCGFGCGNEIWSVDLGSLQTTLEATVGGASGPLAFDASGGLYYGTVSDVFPTPPDASAVLHWTASQLAATGVLTQADAQLVGDGFAGAARLAFDAEGGALFLAENNFTSGANRIRRVLGSALQSPVVLEGRNGLSLANLTLRSNSDPALFAAYQPASGGSLFYTTTDFAVLAERIVLTPLRPSASVSGPGTSGPGPFDVALAQGPPGGSARLYVGPSARYHSLESALLFRGLPLFFGLDLPTTSGVPGLLRLDALGNLAQGYLNPGTYQGLFALQFLVLDAQGHVAGTSSAGFL